jgi:hypothetical protein
MLAPRWALVATAFYALNPNLLYLSTTAMTEPLFLALLIWITLLTVECVEAIRAEQQSRVARRLIWLGALIFAAVFTRYDGWVLGAAVWCVVVWQLWRAQGMWRRVAPAFAVLPYWRLPGLCCGCGTTGISATIRWTSCAGPTRRRQSRRGPRRNTIAGGAIRGGLCCCTRARRRWLRRRGRRDSR